MKSTLQSEATSRSARGAADDKEGHPSAGDASHLAAASSKPSEEDTRLSAAAPSDSRVSAADHSISANGHGCDADADTETDRHVNGSKQQQVEGSEQPLSGERDDVQASAGQGKRKRKSKGKKGRSRAAKRQSQHDETTEATAGQDQDPGSPEAVPGDSICNEQGLTDLREAAVMWAQKAQQSSSKEQKESTPQQ